MLCVFHIRAMDVIKKAGSRLSFLIAKSDDDVMGQVLATATWKKNGENEVRFFLKMFYFFLISNIMKIYNLVLLYVYCYCDYHYFLLYNYSQFNSPISGHHRGGGGAWSQPCTLISTTPPFILNIVLYNETFFIKCFSFVFF